MPNGDLAQQGEASADETTQWQSRDSDSEESDDSSISDEVKSPPRSERHTKQTHDLAGGRGKAVASRTQALKRIRTSTHDKAEKAPKQPKVAPAKPQKALPKMKVDVPVASV